MNADSFLDDIRDAHGTELSRLGSSKAVYALTGGEMEGDAVQTGTARELHAIASVLREWAADASDEASDLYAAAADFAATYADTFDSEAATEGDDSDSHVVADSLATADSADRPAAMAAAFLVLEEIAGQLVGFFVGDADRTHADEFREFRTELADYRDDAADLLGDRAESEADRGAAHDVGAGVVEGAYDWYVERLEGMGVQPKNVC
jgi:hypothetical protein